MNEKSNVKNYRKPRKSVPKRVTLFVAKACFFDATFDSLSQPAARRCRAPRIIDFHRNLNKSDAETDLSEFSLCSSQLLRRTCCKRFWENFGMRCREDDAEDDGGNVLKYCGQLSRCSLIVLRTPCTQLRLRDLSAFYFGVRRCHAARRLQ